MNSAMWEQNIKQPRTGADGILDATTLVINSYFLYRIVRFGAKSNKKSLAKM